MVRTLTGILLVVLLVVAGCADQEPTPSTEAASASSGARGEMPDTAKHDRRGSDPEPPPAVPRKVIGGVGESATGCELPARFMMTAQWNARSVRAMTATERADLVLACEVYSPSERGLLRVWIGDEYGSDPRSALRAFLDDRTAQGKRAGTSGRADRAGHPRYTALVAGGGNGWQVTYPHPADDGNTPVRIAAFALPLDDGVLLVSMGPMPSKRYERMLPIYVLAKTTIVVDREQETRGTR